jgi:H+/Cl- antiporter ClcA
VARRNVDFLCAVVIVGLLAGVAGLSTILLLRLVEHATYNYTFGSLLQGVTGSSPVRRALGPVVGGALAGLGWWILRSRTDIAPLAPVHRWAGKRLLANSPRPLAIWVSDG